MSLDKAKMLEMYTTMQKIRKFERQAATSVKDELVQGFVHLYIGEEAIATGVCANLTDKDYITSTHRGHGHIIAKGGDLKLMMAELCGRKTGYCKGKGGSMHIADLDIGVLGANGIVGGGFNLACGAAMAEQLRGTDNVAVCFFGDGATGVGSFHEAMNIASVWKLPVIFVNENNQWAVNYPTERSGNTENVADRALGYGMPTEIVDGNDLLSVYDSAKRAVLRARRGEGPTLLEYKTYRVRSHCEGGADIRTRDEIKVWRQKDKDPIPRFEEVLLSQNIATEEELKAIQKEIDEAVAEAIRFTEESGFPDVEAALEDVYTDMIMEGR